MDFVKMTLKADNFIYVIQVDMDFRLTWTSGGHGLQVDMDFRWTWTSD